MSLRLGNLTCGSTVTVLLKTNKQQNNKTKQLVKHPSCISYALHSFPLLDEAKGFKLQGEKT